MATPQTTVETPKATTSRLVVGTTTPRQATVAGTLETNSYSPTAVNQITTPMETHDVLSIRVDPGRHLFNEQDRRLQQEEVVRHFHTPHEPDEAINEDIDEPTCRPPYDQSDKQDSLSDHRDPLSAASRGKLLCHLCREKEAAIDSHLIPESVLNYLCRWKHSSFSASDAEPKVSNLEKQKKELDAREQRPYMFRTDIEQGKAVSARECTTIYKRFLCDPCEKQFQHLDDCAYKYWRELKLNWVSGECKHISIKGKNMTDIVLFSFMIRAARVSLRLKWEIAHKSLEEAKCTFLKDTDKDFKETVKKLRDFGFVYCCLNRDKKYRIEFPVFCAFQLKEHKMNFKAISMQVPPFFFLLPVVEESETAENCSQVKLLLTNNLPDIAQAVQTKLQKLLDKFVEQQILLDQFVEQQQQNRDSKDKRKSGLAHSFHMWYSNSHQTQSSPLLIFDYIDEGLNQLDIELNIY